MTRIRRTAPLCPKAVPRSWWSTWLFPKCLAAVRWCFAVSHCTALKANSVMSELRTFGSSIAYATRVVLVNKQNVFLWWSYSLLSNVAKYFASGLSEKMGLREGLGWQAVKTKIGLIRLKRMNVQKYFVLCRLVLATMIWNGLSIAIYHFTLWELQQHARRAIDCDQQIISDKSLSPKFYCCRPILFIWYMRSRLIVVLIFQKKNVVLFLSS